MDENSIWKHQSDWYSPTRLHNSPVDYDFPGDRFIPNRSLMDLDQAHSLLTTTSQKPSKLKFKKLAKSEHESKIDNSLEEIIKNAESKLKTRTPEDLKKSILQMVSKGLNFSSSGEDKMSISSKGQ
ncbi:WD repeat domain-containing protein [Forsythia ovata]|uniref:WD repeat domain-containing protein n=1 Tax=Forsythia ovata TaxID=205694 RepID=A0ABD1X903_9LAMI